ncbi:MAG: hypothetical protein HY080_01895 [Gammaproteobacteria bacterium]|nr:hypothetical protein [Gammaproteobacteria bacterium]
MKAILFVGLILFVTACHGAESDYVETDKIQLQFNYDVLSDENEKIIEDADHVRFYFRFDIPHITWIEISDVSADYRECAQWRIYSHTSFRNSPSTIVSFTTNPDANVREIDFDMPLPCAAFHQAFYYLVKVKSLGGNYFVRKKFPAKAFYHSSSEY